MEEEGAEVAGQVHLDHLFSRSIEQGCWRARVPLAIHLSEIPLDGVAEDGGHDGVAVAPRRGKLVGELVVLDILVAGVSLGKSARCELEGGGGYGLQKIGHH